MNICEKYYWIMNHPKYVPFGNEAIIEITPHMVCPVTNCVENIDELNTKLQFWVELMIPYYDEDFNQHTHAHDWDMDCGGDTWEEAVEALYNLVLIKYGDYTEQDLENHRKEAMKSYDPSIFSMMNAENNISLPEEMIPLSEYEIEFMKEQIAQMTIAESILHEKINDPAITLEEYFDAELELIALEHDLYVMQESIKHGYDVEKYQIKK